MIFWNTFGEDIKGAVLVITDFLFKTFDNVFNLIEGILDVFIGVFTGDWDRMFEGIMKIGNAFKDHMVNMFELLVTAVKAPMNGLIGMANGVISGFESMVNAIGSAINRIPDIDIPDWVPEIGGKSFGIKHVGRVNLGKIPSLNVGTNQVLEDGLAMLHAGEKVVPAKHSGPYEEQVYQSGDIVIEHMEVTKKSDIKEVARELHRLQKTKLKARGV